MSSTYAIVTPCHSFVLQCWRLRRKDAIAATNPDVHVAFDPAGDGTDGKFLVGVNVFRYNRPKVTTPRSSSGQLIANAFLS